MDSQELLPNDDVPEGRTWESEKVRKYAFVSKRALQTDHIGYCYRDEPETNIDSGWRFLHGDEDEEYLSNPVNSEAVYPDEMISINPALDIILGSPVNSEFEWNEEEERYVEILTG